MSFVYPSFLWCFTLLTIPIVIHLYNFRKYKVLYFSSLQFVKQVNQTSQKTRKLKHRLVLLSRLLFLSFLILAFAQPYRTNNTAIASGIQVHAIYLDNSFSMDRKSTEGTLFLEAKEAAKRLIEKSPPQYRWLLMSNSLNAAEELLLTRSEALQRLDELKLSSNRKSLQQIYSWIAQWITQFEMKQTPIRELKLIWMSDFQKNLFSAPERPIKEERIVISPLYFTPQNEDNLTIDSVWFEQPNNRLGENRTLMIRVHNYSDVDRKNVEIQVNLTDVKRDFFVDIPAQSFHIAPITYTDQRSTGSIKKGVVSVLDRQMIQDDAFYLSYPVQESCNVLLINADDAVDNVRQVYQQDDFYNIKEIQLSAFTTDLLSSAQLVILNGVNEISASVSKDIYNFYAENGQLLIFPGTKANSASLNSLLRSLQLPQLNNVLFSGIQLKNLTYEDPFYETLFEKEPKNLNLPLMEKVYSSPPTGINLATMQNGKSLFSTNVQRRAYLLHTSLQSDFSQLVQNALFPALCLRVAELSNRIPPLYLTKGKSEIYPIPGQSSSEKPIQLKSNDFAFVPYSRKSEYGEKISIEGANEELLNAGLYETVGRASQAVIAINYDRKESAIAVLPVEQVEDWMETQGWTVKSGLVVKNGQGSQELSVLEPEGWWRWMVVLALIFLIGEMALLKFWKS